jgi:hypothetical protein
MWKAMLEYLGDSIGVITSPKGVVIPSVLDSGSNLGDCASIDELSAKLTPLVPEGYRLSILEPSFKYPEPAIFIGPALVRDKNEQNQKAFDNM